MSIPALDSIDDFYVTPSKEEALSELIDVYTEFENQLDSISKKVKLTDSSSKLKLFREVYTYKKSGALFRCRDDASHALIMYWLSRVKDVALKYSSFNDLPVFNGISKNELKQIAQLSSDTDNLAVLEELLANKGIIFLTEKSIPGLKLDGSVFLLESGQAVVALSLRYKRLDYFWFTLMHELAHLCLHHDQLSAPIIEDLDGEATSLIELEADKLALNSFIPRNVWRNCPPKYNTSEETIISFANDVGVHPVIVAGRLRKELKRFDIYSKLINSIDVQEYFS